MIFITLGTQACNFSRCMRMVEEIIKSFKIDEPIIAQVGHTSYNSSLISCFDFVSEQQYQDLISSARIVISHAGTGALFSSIKKGKKVIAVARLKKYGEMVDDHQKEIVAKLSSEGYILDGTDSLLSAWSKIDAFTPKRFNLECTLPQEIMAIIDTWLCSSQPKSSSQNNTYL